MGGAVQKTGSAADLLLDIPYLLTARIVPPLHVVNDLLAKGISDAGMSGGCEWEPLQITASEWDEVAAVLRALSYDEAYEFVEPPIWVETVDDWHAWIMMHTYGLPDAFRALDREVRDLEHARAQAMREGNQELVEELHLRVIEAGGKLSQLVMEHRKAAG